MRLPDCQAMKQEDEIKKWKINNWKYFVKYENFFLYFYFFFIYSNNNNNNYNKKINDTIP